MAPIVAIKAAALLTGAAKIQYSITELSLFPFFLPPPWEMSLRSGSLLFLIQLEEPFLSP